MSSFLLTTGILIGSFVGFWYGPWSLNLDHRARNLIVQDHLQEGVDLFCGKQSMHFRKTQSMRLFGMLPEQSLCALNPVQIKELLNRCLEEERIFIYRAEVHAQLATLLFEEQPRESTALGMGFVLWSSERRVCDLRVRLAMVLEAEGKMVEAIDVWEEALGYPISARMAHGVG